MVDCTIMVLVAAERIERNAPLVPDDPRRGEWVRTLKKARARLNAAINALNDSTPPNARGADGVSRSASGIASESIATSERYATEAE
jgi:hypothetical protein